VRRILILLLLAVPAAGDTAVTLLHFSDYHSHALPFYTDEGERGGLARAIGYLKREKHRGALVFSGGDMLNKGAPAWSDRYGCAEWPWFNGIVDAMAFGNHDADYGKAAFERCRKKLHYPVLSAITDGFARWTVVRARGVRIGVFAIAGPDFPQLVKAEGLIFSDSVAAARATVRTLREEQHVDAVILIGHEHAAADYELARSVPGIDLIFGTHSHLKSDLVQIPGTQTAFISPSQYLTFISRVELTIADGHVTGVKGGLVPVDVSLPEDATIARRVARMQRELESDPHYRASFDPIGTLDAPMSTREVASRTLVAMREAVHADVALSTTSSFRGPLPAGVLTAELLRTALPYDNEIVLCTMDAPHLTRLLGEVSARQDESGAWATPVAVVEDRPYRVAVTDYMVAAPAWREFFDCHPEKSGLRVRSELQKVIAVRPKGQ
jgi:5'-nucleotidase/UDP-sugar diphosphatase